MEIYKKSNSYISYKRLLMLSIHNLGTNCGKKIWMKHMHSSEKGDEDERQWPDIVSDEQISYWLDTVCHVPVSSRFWSVVYFFISSEIFVYFYSLMMVMYTIITWIMKQEGLIHWKW